MTITLYIDVTRIRFISTTCDGSRESKFQSQSSESTFISFVDVGIIEKLDFFLVLAK